VHNMDGFYVAKFRVEKRAKVKKGPEDGAEVMVEVVAEDGTVVEQKQEDVAFDSDEDKPYLEEAKRRRMKAKGLRPPPRSKAPNVSATAKASA